MTVDRRYVWVSTDGEIVEFRPTRIAWKGANSFSIIGTDHRTRLRLVTLRFERTKDAQEAAAVLDLGIVERASEAIPEGIPVEIRYYFPRAIWLILLFLLLPYSLAGILVGFSLWSPSSIIVFLIVVLVLRGGVRLWIGPMTGARFGWLGGFTRTGAVKGWIRMEGNSLIVRTSGYDSGPLFPSKVLWKSPSAFTIETAHGKIELSFSSPEDATGIFQMIRRSFPSVQEEHGTVG